MKGSWRRAEVDEDGDWYRPEQPRLFWYFSPAPFILLSFSSSIKFPSLQVTHIMKSRAMENHLSFLLTIAVADVAVAPRNRSPSRRTTTTTTTKIVFVVRRHRRRIVNAAAAAVSRPRSTIIHDIGFPAKRACSFTRVEGGNTRRGGGSSALQSRGYIS